MKYILIILFTATGLFVSAQDYNSAIGLRLGVPLSVSYKTFLNESAAVEVYGSFRSYSSYSWVALSGAYLVHKDISSVENLRWYFGGGASVYFWSFDFDLPGFDQSSTSIGINGYLGLEYTLENAPVSFTVDWVPTFFLNGYGDGFAGGQGALGVRYILGR